MKIRVGSRESRLAVIQAELLMEAVRAAHPNIALELVTMKTTGDRILDRTLDKIGGKGLFVRELDQALRDGRVDVTVHSCKDLPMEEDAALPGGPASGGLLPAGGPPGRVGPAPGYGRIGLFKAHRLRQPAAEDTAPEALPPGPGRAGAGKCADAAG